jgi:polyvinyl alcohol dehydrogenase (cytochrome)
MLKRRRKRVSGVRPILPTCVRDMKTPNSVRLLIFPIAALLSGLALQAISLPPAQSAALTEQTPADQAATLSPEGDQLYKQKCAACHDNAEGRVPPLFLLRRRRPEEVVQILTSGAMKQQAAGLSPDQIQALAVFVTGKQMGTTASAFPLTSLCKAAASPINLKAAGWNGWGHDLENSRFQPKPGLAAEDIGKLKLKWAFGYPGTITYGQPTVIGDHLYVTTEAGWVYCLNTQTGCVYWQIKADSGVRTAISVGALPASAPVKFAAYFGDEKSFVHAVDAETGKELWKKKIEDHPVSRITGAPLLYRDRIYVPVSSFEEGAGRDPSYECCKFRGSITALNAYTGEIIWKTFSIADEPKPYKKNSKGTQMYGPAGAAIWSAPTLDVKRKVIYAGTGNSYTDVPTGGANAIVAFDMDRGRVKWQNQVTAHDNFLVGCRQPGVGNCPDPVGPDFDFGSSPILRTLPNGKQIILAGQKSGVVSALDPDDHGKILWQTQVGLGGALGGVEWGPAADESNIYVAISDVAMPPDKRLPGLTALKISTGDKVWSKPAPAAQCSWGNLRCTNAQSAAVTVIPGVVFSGSLDGHLRAYSTKDGSVVWDFDTAEKPYENTANGIKAKGGSIDTGGVAVAGGMLFVNSGYGRFVGQPGNVLLAFSVDGE